MLSLRFGAGEESRTLDLNLGKVALYQLSYSRVEAASIPKNFPPPDTGLKIRGPRAGGPPTALNAARPPA